MSPQEASIARTEFTKYAQGVKLYPKYKKAVPRKIVKV